MNRSTPLVKGAAAATAVLIVGASLYMFIDGRSTGTDNSSPPVELVSHEGETEGGRPVQVTGVVRNTSDRRHGRIKVTVRFFDKAGSQVGDTTAQTTGLGPGKEWRFKVPVVGDSVARYEVERVTWE